MAIKGRAIERRDDTTTLVTAKAGEDWSQFVAWTLAQGIGGLENLAGIPGTVGAAPIQYIGAYGVELAERRESLTVFDTLDGNERRFTPDECRFSYRHSLFKELRGRFIVLEATFALPRAWAPVLSYPGLDTLQADVDAASVMARVLSLRGSKLPDWRVIGNVGSFFHNPVVRPEIADTIGGVPRYPQPDGTVKLSAAWLIDACGLKGHRHGRAGIYEGHALIIVNHGGATYREISDLSAKVRHTVMERFGVSLTQEPIEF
jgi:UDP-N-acetylmuramate dehydrogenase